MLSARMQRIFEKLKTHPAYAATMTPVGIRIQRPEAGNVLLREDLERDSLLVQADLAPLPQQNTAAKIKHLLGENLFPATFDLVIALDPQQRRLQLYGLFAHSVIENADLEPVLAKFESVLVTQRKKLTPGNNPQPNPSFQTENSDWVLPMIGFA